MYVYVNREQIWTRVVVVTRRKTIGDRTTLWQNTFPVLMIKSHMNPNAVKVKNKLDINAANNVTAL